MDRGKESLVLEGTGEEVQALWQRGPSVIIVSLMVAFLGWLSLVASLGGRFQGLAIRLGYQLNTFVGLASRPFLLFLGFWFLFLAYQTWLKKAAAFYFLMGWLFIQSITLFLLYGRVIIPLLTLSLLPILWHFRREYFVRPDPNALRKLKIVAPVFLAAFFLLEGIDFWLLQINTGWHGNPLVLFRYILNSVLGNIPVSHAHGLGSFLCRYCTLFFCLGVLWCTSLLFRPHEDKAEVSEGDREKARVLVRRHGSDSIAYFNLRRDKRLYLLDDRAFLAYRCFGGTVLVTGDPVGEPGCVTEIMAHFRNHCFERGWRLACLGVGPRHLEDYSRLGLKGICYGEEAVVDLERFTLEGRKNKSLRHAVHKWEKAGARMEFMFNAGIPSHLRHELQRISSDWRGNRPETGFSMGLGRLLHSEDPDCLLALAYDRNENPIGFAYLVPIYPRLGYSLDVTRIDRKAPNGLNDFILAKTALFLRDRGYRVLSLHFAAFSTHYRPDREEQGSALVRSLCRLADHILPVMSLYEYDRKFQPGWQPRYLLLESYLDLPRAGLAALGAESFHHLAKRNKWGHIFVFRSPLRSRKTHHLRRLPP